MRNATSPESPAHPCHRMNGRRVANGTIADTKRAGRHYCPVCHRRNRAGSRGARTVAQYLQRPKTILFYRSYKIRRHHFLCPSRAPGLSSLFSLSSHISTSAVGNADFYRFYRFFLTFLQELVKRRYTPTTQTASLGDQCGGKMAKLNN